MNHHRSLKLIALLSLATLSLGSIACSNGSSPTEPAAFDDSTAFAASTTTMALVTEESRGNDDNGGDNRGGKGGKGGKGGRGGRDDNPRTGREFEGSVTAVRQGTLTLAGGTRIVVNAQTQWIARGDLHTLAQVSRSVAAGRPTRVEGRGTRRADGSIVAQTLKAEVD